MSNNLWKGQGHGSGRGHRHGLGQINYHNHGGYNNNSLNKENASYKQKWDNDEILERK